ncbi:MAG TPA: GNAT family N-acetyltransferase, partial [Usitatibacter sp.]|nr:GNAT family N-acetyltransferase [Usitatibacter sp.]
MSTRFERPHAALADSYRAMIGELHDRDEELIPFPLSFDNADFAAFLARLDAASRGEGIPADFVANTTYWLVDERGEVVAVSNLRHALTEKLRIEGGHIGYGVRPSARRRGHATEILRRTLEQARERGIEEALVTCAKENMGSRGAILRCGGRLHSEDFVERRGEVVQRY